MPETDAEFVERMARLEATPEGRMDPDVARLFALARRGAAADAAACGATVSLNPWRT